MTAIILAAVDAERRGETDLHEALMYVLFAARRITWRKEFRQVRGHHAYH